MWNARVAGFVAAAATPGIESMTINLGTGKANHRIRPKDRLFYQTDRSSDEAWARRELSRC
jgi:hypothetical protein